MKAKAGTALKQQDDKKVVGRPFKPGQSGNPKGRPKKGIRYMNEMLAAEWFEPARRVDVEASYMAMVTMPEEKLKKVLADKEAPMLARIIAKELLGARWFDAAERVLDRGIGKSMQRTETEVQVNTVSLDLTDAARKALAMMDA